MDSRKFSQSSSYEVATSQTSKKKHFTPTDFLFFTKKKPEPEKEPEKDPKEEIFERNVSGPELTEKDLYDPSFLKKKKKKSQNLPSDNPKMTHLSRSGEELSVPKQTKTQVLKLDESKKVNHRSTSPKKNRKNFWGLTWLFKRPTSEKAHGISEVIYEPPNQDETSIPISTVLDVKSFEDLPKKIARIVEVAGIPKDLPPDQFLTLLNILYFQTKTKFRAVEEQKKLNKLQESMDHIQSYIHRPRSDERPCFDPEDLFFKGEPLTYYKVEKEEGKGGFGTVYRAISRKNPSKQYAIKVMPHVSERDKLYNLSEIGFLQFCNHPNIVHYFRSFLVDKEVWCVMEYLEGGSLATAVKTYRFPELQIAYVAKEVLKALCYLHSENLLHRDIKSSNIMLSTEADVKLVDFGLCVDISDGPRNSMVGSPFWMPPEMILRKPYSYKADIYSFIVCMMELANGHAPNHRSGTRAMFIAATTGYTDKPFNDPTLFSPTAHEFFIQCLQMDPSLRPTAEEALAHPFLQKTESQEMMKQVLSGIFILNSILPF